VSMDFGNKTAGFQVTVRHLSQPHHLDDDLFSVTSYGPLASDGNCVFTDCSRECLTAERRLRTRAHIIGFLRFPYLATGGQLSRSGGARVQRNGRPRGSPAPSPCVWRAISRTPVCGPDCRVTIAKPRASTTQRHASRSISTSNDKIRHPQRCPPQSALIPI
jgi:hypothetical protein